MQDQNMSGKVVQTQEENKEEKDEQQGRGEEDEAD
jgi:hypothetical protein